MQLTKGCRLPSHYGSIRGRLCVLSAHTYVAFNSSLYHKAQGVASQQRNLWTLEGGLEIDKWTVECSSRRRRLFFEEGEGWFTNWQKVARAADESVHMHM